MRRILVASLGYSTLAVASLALGGAQLGCGAEGQAQGEHVIRAAQAIEGGTVDQSDNNVVSILINSSQGLSLCSGSLIGPNLVLSAHHCVATPPSNVSSCGGKFSATYSASSFMVTNSYDAAANIFDSNNPTWPQADGVTWWAVSTVNVPTTNDICAGDQSLLTLSQNMNGVCPLIPAVDVQPTANSDYTAIGFGITSPNSQTAGTRYKVTGMQVICDGASACGDNSIAASGEWEGGSSSNKGTCEGDSGGPALDASNRILGTVSRGPQNACNQTVYEATYDSGGTTNGAWIKQIAQQAATAGGYTVAGWVTGGATSDPSNGYACSTTSSSSSSSASSASSSTGSTSSGGCPSGLNCVDGSGMGNYGCFEGTGTNISFPPNAPTCSGTQACPSGWDCWASSQNAQTGSCIEECTPGASSTTSSSSSASSAGGVGTNSSTSTGTASTGTGNVVTVGSASTGTAGTAGTASGGAGGGATTTTNGAGAGIPAGFTPVQSSSCSVRASGDAPASPASLAGLVLGAALLVSRRRRQS